MGRVRGHLGDLTQTVNCERRPLGHPWHALLGERTTCWGQGVALVGGVWADAEEQSTPTRTCACRVLLSSCLQSFLLAICSSALQLCAATTHLLAGLILRRAPPPPWLLVANTSAGCCHHDPSCSVTFPAVFSYHTQLYNPSPAVFSCHPSYLQFPSPLGIR